MDEAGRARAINTILRNASLRPASSRTSSICRGSPTGRMRLDSSAWTSTRSSRPRWRRCARPRAPRSITLGAELDRSLGTMEGAPDRLQQVVWNLLMNSVKFTPSGGRVEVSSRRGGRGGDHRRDGHGSRYRPEVASARIRAVPAGGQLKHARPGWSRPRSHARPPPCGAARGARPRGESGQGRGRDVHRHAAARHATPRPGADPAARGSSAPAECRRSTVCACSWSTMTPNRSRSRIWSGSRPCCSATRGCSSPSTCVDSCTTSWATASPWRPGETSALRALARSPGAGTPARGHRDSRRPPRARGGVRSLSDEPIDPLALTSAVADVTRRAN